MLKKLFHTKNKLTDLELIAKYKATDDNYFVGELYTRYTHLVFGVCMKYYKNESDSQDAVTQIFEKLLKDLKVFEVTNFKAWLHRVVKNHCLMQLRKNQTLSKRKDEYANSVKSNVEYDQPMHHLDEDDAEKQLAKLREAIDELKDEQKRCIELFFLQEKSYQEIADETEYTLKQVKSYIQNGKRNLKNKLTLSLLLCVILETLFR
ncbi:MAG: RNA polymerase sigma factor [Flammeovirgaceae bacterium]